MTHAITGEWKSKLRNTHVYSTNIIINHQVVKQNLIKSLEKMNSKDLYLILILTTQAYFATLFRENNLNWKLIYLLPRIISQSISSKKIRVRAFHQKIRQKMLTLN